MKRAKLFFFMSSIILVAVLTQAVHAEVHVPSIIGDNMVLQQDSKCVFGERLNQVSSLL